MPKLNFDTVLVFVFAVMLAVVYTVLRFHTIEDEAIKNLLITVAGGFIGLCTNRRQANVEANINKADVVLDNDGK